MLPCAGTMLVSPGLAVLSDTAPLGLPVLQTEGVHLSAFGCPWCWLHTSPHGAHSSGGSVSSLLLLHLPFCLLSQGNFHFFPQCRERWLFLNLCIQSSLVNKCYALLALQAFEGKKKPLFFSSTMPGSCKIKASVFTTMVHGFHKPLLEVRKWTVDFPYRIGWEVTSKTVQPKQKERTLI